MRHLLLGLVLLALYAGTSALAAAHGSDYGEVEAHHLLIAESLVSDRDLDLTDEYVARDYRSFFEGELEPHGRVTAGRLHEPYGPGFSMLIAPAYALAGARGAALLCAGLAALAFVAALPLARVVVPEPWATRGVALVALSPPAVAHAATVEPGWAAAALLAVAILLTARARDDARLPAVAGAALALALLPWLDPLIALAGLPVAALLLRWTLRQHRRLAALIAAEVLSSSLIAFTALSEVLYGGLTPLAAALPGETAIGAGSVAGYLDRAPRMASLWLDRDFGLVRWAPVLALAFYGVWLLWRSRRDHISRALPGRREGEAVAALVSAVCLMVLLVAVFGAPDTAGDWFPGRWLLAVLAPASVLVAWSLRHLPRTGAVLGGLTLLATAWLCIELASGRLDGWATAPASQAPWGPLKSLLPAWNGESAWPDAVSIGIALGLLGLLVAEWRSRERRRTANIMPPL